MPPIRMTYSESDLGEARGPTSASACHFPPKGANAAKKRADSQRRVQAAWSTHHAVACATSWAGIACDTDARALSCSIMSAAFSASITVGAQV